MELLKFEHGVEITLANPDDFLKIKETLTRIGVKSKKSNILYQSVNILHKRGKYYLLHFKEFFILDGKLDNMCDDDYRRRNTITKLISQWGMCKIVFPVDVELTLPMSEITIIPYKDKKDYQLIAKYTVGGRK
jgi:hypothetical protein